MEARWLALSPDDQFGTRCKNPSLEDVAKTKALKEKRDKELAKEREKAGVKEPVVDHLEADERHEREEEEKRKAQEMSAQKTLSPQEMEEKELADIGVPIAKVRLPCPSSAQALGASQTAR